MIFMKCPVGCDSHLVKSGIAVPECELYRCDVCGQLLSSADESLYESTMKRFDDAARIDMNPRIHKRRLRRIMRYWSKKPSETHFLDVGSSFGMFLNELRRTGFDAEGVEPSREAYDKCLSEGFRVHHGYLEDIGFADKSFDVLTLFEVVEHLKNPRHILSECHRILRPGGMLFISTGNTDSLTVRVLKGKWDYFSMMDGGQGHISFFNPKSISLLAGSVGFDVHAIETRSVKFVNSKSAGRPARIIGKLAQELANPIAKALNMGHDMLVVLKKHASLG